jgi:hypothetical protein
MKKSFLSRPALLLSLGLFALTSSAYSQSIVSNSDFEKGLDGWGTFVPNDSKDKNCIVQISKDNPHGGTQCVQLKVNDYARFAVATTAIPVTPGDRYQVSVWFHGDATAQQESGSPGFVLRLTLSGDNKDAPGGSIFILPGNLVCRGSVPPTDAPLPTGWTQMKAIVEVPPGADMMGSVLFAWHMKGSLFVDDF